MTQQVLIDELPADEKWDKMKSAWLACEDAGVPIPDKVFEFFGGEPPGDKPGAEIEIYDAFHEWGCLELDITKLPPEVKIIRFYNSR